MGTVRINIKKDLPSNTNYIIPNFYVMIILKNYHLQFETLRL